MFVVNRLNILNTLKYLIQVTPCTIWLLIKALLQLLKSGLTCESTRICNIDANIEAYSRWMHKLKT